MIMFPDDVSNEFMLSYGAMSNMFCVHMIVEIVTYTYITITYIYIYIFIYTYIYIFDDSHNNETQMLHESNVEYLSITI